MRLPLTEKFKLSVPARKVALLPDTYFFFRRIPVENATAPQDVAAMLELAVEGMAPFPLSQMYQGSFWRPGWKHALVYASYRKRFTAEQVEAWSDAEVVVPACAAMLNASLAEPTTLLFWSEKTLTVLQWDDPQDAPTKIISRELPPELKQEERDAFKEAVLKETGVAVGAVEQEWLPTYDGKAGDDGLVFRCASVESTYSREQLDVLDVRDKEEMTTRRRARARDMLLWRAVLACAAVVAFCILLEVGLVGGRILLKARTATVAAQETTVSKILLTQNLAQRVDELSTRRMRPFEMISMISEKLPASVIFTSTTITGLYTLDLEAQAGVSEDVNTYHAALTSLPGIDRVETKFSRVQNGQTKFGFLITFKPSAFQGGPQS